MTVNPIHFLQALRRGANPEEILERVAGSRAEEFDQELQGATAALSAQQQSVEDQFTQLMAIVEADTPFAGSEENLARIQSKLQELKAFQEHLQRELTAKQEELQRRTQDAAGLSKKMEALNNS